MRQISRQLKNNNKTIAFVPTMGNLHDGHLSLVKIAKQQADIVIVSIFVNPSQFGPSEDYNSYPRTFDADQKSLADQKVDYLFCPNAQDIYTNNSITTRIHPTNLETLLCGKTRPQFFSGVATIVSILFNIIDPDIAVFGEKDYQQLLVIRQLVRDLHYSIKIISAPIIRESSGLAMSSRNNYLNTTQLTVAAELYKILSAARDEIQSTLKNTVATINTTSLINNYKIKLSDIGLKVDYLDLCNCNDLSHIATISKNLQYTHTELVLLVAAYLDKTRLIDNIKFYLN